MFVRRLSVLPLLFCVACSGQANRPAKSSQPIAPEVSLRVEQQIRARFNIPPDVTVTPGTPAPSEFPNYDLLPVTMARDGKTQTIEFLLSKDGKTLIRFTKIDLTRDVYAETMNKINLANRPVRGNPNAKVTVVNFDDFECPFCARMHSTLMSQILPQYGDKIRIVYKDFPLVQIHPWAEHAATDADCLAAESGSAYWQLADYLHENHRSISAGQHNSQATFDELDKLTMDFGKKNGADLTRLQACVKAQPDQVVKASMAEGDALGISATPTVFINGERLEGALDAGEVRAAINRQLVQAGVQPPPSAAGAPSNQPPAIN